MKLVRPTGLPQVAGIELLKFRTDESAGQFSSWYDAPVGLVAVTGQITDAQKETQSLAAPLLVAALGVAASKLVDPDPVVLLNRVGDYLTSEGALDCNLQLVVSIWDAQAGLLNTVCIGNVFCCIVGLEGVLEVVEPLAQIQFGSAVSSIPTSSEITHSELIVHGFGDLPAVSSEPGLKAIGYEPNLASSEGLSLLLRRVIELS